VSLGLKGLEGRGEVGDGALVADSLGGDRVRVAVGGVDHEVRPVDIDLDRAQAQWDPADDRGGRFGVGEDVGVVRIDVEGDPDARTQRTPPKRKREADNEPPLSVSRYSDPSPPPVELLEPTVLRAQRAKLC
jgi:hypothetical protein